MFNRECVNKQLRQVLLFHAIFSILDAVSTVIGLTYFEHTRESNIVMSPIVDVLGTIPGMGVYLLLMAGIGSWIYFFNNLLHNQFTKIHVLALGFPISGLWMTNVLRLTVVVNNLGQIISIPSFVSGDIDRLIMIPIGYMFGFIQYRMCN